MKKVLKEINRIPRNIYKVIWKIKNKGVLMIDGKELKVNSKYSQFGQDKFIYETFFKGKKNGIFCDVGGNHPISINNTYMFEQMGWTGYCFEPLPQMEKLWQKHRTAKFFPYACTEKSEQLNFTVVDGEDGWEDALSYVTDSLSHDISHDNFKTKQITVEGRRIQDIFDEHNVTHIDYMSMDVEGHELQALKGIDFNKTRINVITLENNPDIDNTMGFDVWKFGEPSLQEFVKSKGFKLYGRIMGLDDIYVHKDFNPLANSRF